MDGGREMPTAQPCIVVRGSLECIMDAFQVVEKKILAEVPAKELPLALLSAFYTFNMHYPQGCTNLYSFWNVFLWANRPLIGRLDFLVLLHE